MDFVSGTFRFSIFPASFVVTASHFWELSTFRFQHSTPPAYPCMLAIHPPPLSTILQPSCHLCLTYHALPQHYRPSSIINLCSSAY